VGFLKYKSIIFNDIPAWDTKESEQNASVCEKRLALESPELPTEPHSVLRRRRWIPGPAVRIGQKQAAILVPTGARRGPPPVPWSGEERIKAKEAGNEKDEQRSRTEERAPIGAEKEFVHG
jgi:hypothetical protein